MKNKNFNFKTHRCRPHDVLGFLKRSSDGIDSGSRVQSAFDNTILVIYNRYYVVPSSGNRPSSRKSDETAENKILYYAHQPIGTYIINNKCIDQKNRENRMELIFTFEFWNNLLSPSSDRFRPTHAPMIFFQGSKTHVSLDQLSVIFKHFLVQHKCSEFQFYNFNFFLKLKL